MGQNVIGLMLGCMTPSGVAMHDEEGSKFDGEGLLDRWEKVVKKSHAAAFKKNHYGARAMYVPDHPHDESGSRLIGFWVAGIEEHNTDSHETMDDGPVSIADLAKSDRYQRADEAWRDFAGWATAQGVKLKKPSLYLAQTEVA